MRAPPQEHIHVHMSSCDQEAVCVSRGYDGMPVRETYP